MNDKDWREAKMAKWAKEAAEEELRQWQISAALSWPTEPKPTPMPFQWGDYDLLYGEAHPGTFWQAQMEPYIGLRVAKIGIRADNPEGFMPRWEFDTGYGWRTTKVRGPLYASESDARLACLWDECERVAKVLAKARGWIK